MSQRPPSRDRTHGTSFVRLVPREVLRFDAEQRVVFLSADNHEPVADITARARDELGQLLHTATVAHHTCEFEELGQSARRIRRLAVQVGIPDLARVADHVLDCIVQYDSAALGATVARLHRLGLLTLSELGGRGG